MSDCTFTITFTRWSLIRQLPAAWLDIVRTIDVSPRWLAPLVWLYALGLLARAAVYLLFVRRAVREALR